MCQYMKKPRSTGGQLPKRQRQLTWVVLALRNSGFLNAQTALLWAILWAVTRESLGSDPTVEEVAAWWKENERTAYREQAAFRRAFPTLDSPAPIVDVPEMRAKMKELANLGDEMEAGKKAKRRIPESMILEIGLGQAIT